MKVGRNDPCPCGSGKKYKKCCLEKDEAEARPVVAGLVPSPFAPSRVPREDLRSPEQRAADELWDRFEAAGTQEERIRLFRKALDEGSLDAEYAIEMLETINGAASAPEERAAVVGLLEELQARAPEMYEEQFGYYNAWLIEDALDRQEYGALPRLLQPFAQEPDRFVEQLFEIITLLMYHGQAVPLLDLLRRAWPVIRRSTRLVPWAIDEYRELLAALVLCDYADSVPAPRADDPALYAALDEIYRPDEIAQGSVAGLLGESSEPLRIADFQRSGAEALAAELARLTFEWLGDLHRRHGVALVQGELARRALFEYLSRRAELVRGWRLLLPTTESLEKFAEDEVLESVDTGPVYRMARLLELLPRYVDWLVERELAPSAEAGEAVQGLSLVQKSLLRSLEQRGWHSSAIRAIKRAGQVVYEGALPSPDAEPDPLFAQLRRAGKEPGPAILDAVKALGSAAIHPLIAMAIDEQLYFADLESPESWAPLHAVRLLGELEAAEAVEPLLPLLERDDDWLADAVPAAYGRIGQPALEPLRAALLDRDRDLYARGRAANGLAEIAKAHPELRPEAVGALVDCLDLVDLQSFDDATLNGFVIADLITLKAMETLPAIQRAFEADRVDESIVGDYDSVRRDLGDAPGRTPRASAADQKHPVRQPVPEGEQTGRNKPCPCGSGKKYKKCCGR